MIKFIEKLFVLFTPKLKRYLFLLLIPMIISAVLDVVGIAFVIPFMSLVADETLIFHSKKINFLYQLFHFTSPNKFLFVLGIVVFLMLVLGNIFSAITSWLILKFTTICEYAFASKLFTHYIKQPYSYFLNKNSATFSKNIFTELNEVVNVTLLLGMQTVAKSIVVFFIILFLFYVNPVLALSMIIMLGSLYVVIFLISKERLFKVSKELTERQEARHKIVNESFGAIKDIKLLHNENYFIHKFSNDSKVYAAGRGYAYIIGIIPRYALEVVAFGGVLLVVLYLLATKHSTSNVIPMLALYAFAGYRIMPSLQFIFNAVAQSKAHAESVNAVYNDLLEKNYNDNFNDTNNLSTNITSYQLREKFLLKNLNFCYPNINKNIINNINLQIDACKTIGFVGTTGSGKTTIIDIILGLLQPQSGELLMDNIKINEFNIKNWQNNFGYVPQNIYLCDDSIINNIAFGVSIDEIDFAAVESAVKIANIHNFIVNELPNKYETKIGERGIRLSGGQRQRIGIARALYRNPDILILDEATSALDVTTEKIIMDAVYNLAHKKTIIIIAHRLTTVQLCDLIYVIEKGMVVDNGTYFELAERNIVFRNMVHIDYLLNKV